jgi:hypothetical protein
LFHNFLKREKAISCFKDKILKKRKKKSAKSRPTKEEKYYCSVCGCEIDEDEYESFDGMCWECWDDQMTEESEDVFGDV